MNYYVNEEHCASCGRDGEQLHIGKSSRGWCFSLHVYPERGLSDWLDWESWLSIEPRRSNIVDEYDRSVDMSQRKAIGMNRSGNGFHQPPSTYKSWKSFHALNHSEPDSSSGLLRYQIDGHRCVGHGTGTDDLIAGEFS